MIRYKIQCAGVIGDENRKPRSAMQSKKPEVLIGTFLFRTHAAAVQREANLRDAGLEPKLVRVVGT